MSFNGLPILDTLTLFFRQLRGSPSLYHHESRSNPHSFDFRLTHSLVPELTIRFRLWGQSFVQLYKRDHWTKKHSVVRFPSSNHEDAWNGTYNEINITESKLKLVFVWMSRSGQTQSLQCAKEWVAFKNPYSITSYYIRL